MGWVGWVGLGGLGGGDALSTDPRLTPSGRLVIYKIQARFIRLKSACVPSTNTFPYFMRPLHRE